MHLPNQASRRTPMPGFLHQNSSTLLLPTQDSEDLLQVLLQALDEDTGRSSAHGAVYQSILRYLNKRKRFANWGESNKEIAAKLLDQQLFDRADSETDYENLNTLESRLGDLIKFHDPTALNSETLPNNKATSAGPSPKNAIASTTDYANVARNVLSPSFLNPISPSFENGLSALQRNLPNEHHRAHHNGRGFSNEATVTSLNQYVDCRGNQIFQNNYDKWRPSLFQLPSCGNSNELCGRLAFNTNAVQAIDGVVALEGCMDSNLHGDMHMVPDCQFSAPGVSNRPVSSFGSRNASKSMEPSSVHFNSMINCTEVHPRLYQQTEQRSPQVAKVQVPLMDTQAASSEQGYLSQPRQLKSEYRPSLPPYKQLDRLQEQPVLLDNGASLLPSSVSILNGSLKIEGCFVPDPRILEPHTILDAVQQPQTSLDGSPASSNVAVACGSGETRGEKLIDMARSILRAYLHVKTCSRQEECKEPRCTNMKQYFTHILCCNDRQHFAQRCFNIKKLVYHFNVCCKHTCKICSPVRMMGINFSQQAVASNMSLSRADASSIDTIDCLLPPSKRVKKEDPSPFNSSQSENSQLLTLIVDQTQSPQELPHVCTVVSTSVSTRTESMELDADPSASSSKESHANSYEAKVEDSEAAVKVQLGIEPGHSEEILTQCEQGKKHVQSEPDRLKMKAECTISASSAGHVKGTKLGKPKIKGLSLIESFTPEKVREHIRSLSQLDDPKNAETERGRGTELLFDNNTCSLCGMDKLLFETHHRYCGSCSKQISPKGIFYSIEGAYSKANGGHKQISFCCKCYNISSDSVKAGGEEISKTNLVKRWDYAETDAETEWWVQCDKCEAWQHQICALFNGKRNEDVQSEYTCPRCFLQEIENGVRKPLPQSTMLAAKNLPITLLSEHIEQWLFMRLKEERQQRANNLRKNFDEVPGAEGLVVRVVLSVDQKLEVKQHFHEIFKEEKYPAEFPYKSKAILLFQNIEGADVCLFGMFVQEFGSECALPNQRRVCISYIDSVKYFMPEIKAATGEALRSFVYHEILIGYLDYCKKRGFTSCYIWSCPLSKRDDYILYCHPKTQKMPKSDKLREWYQTVIRKAAKENIVVEHTNLYDHFFKSHNDCKVNVTAARLPYFESDYWSGEAETILKKEDGNMPQKKVSKTAINRVLRAAKRDSLNGNPKDIFLMHQLGEIIRPMKEDFIMVHLQHICKCCDQFIVSGNRWVCSVRRNFHLCDMCHSMEQNSGKKDAHTANAREKYSYFKVEVESIRPDTNDGDKVLQNEYFDTRLVFLNLCESNHYQFDTIRRAKHSTMMILYHLHNPTTSVFMSSCIVCHNDIDTAQGWYCKTCPDYDLCDVCYQREGVVRHHHDLVNRATVAGCNLMPYKGIQKQSDMQILLDALVHASKCATPGCTFRYCRNLKTLFHHGLECHIRAAGRCKSCVKMWLILHMHARGCKESECLVPRCKDLRDHMQAELIQSDARRRAGVRKRIRHKES